MKLNLERALRFGDPMGGHIVNGHVDGVGVVASSEQVEGGDRVIRITCAPELLTDIVHKGSIACDGVSLTVVDVRSDGFTVHIIPHTWENTSFSGWADGDRVNLETDVLAKYARAVLRGEEGAMELTWETLARLGRAP
jgi:riboflavin synthase